MAQKTLKQRLAFPQQPPALRLLLLQLLLLLLPVLLKRQHLVSQHQTQQTEDTQVRRFCPRPWRHCQTRRPANGLRR